MAKFTVYGSFDCPGCMRLKDQLQQKNITDFDFVNILENLVNLKAFLKIRDNAPEYVAIRERGGVGIPLIVTPSGNRLHDMPENIEELYK